MNAFHIKLLALITMAIDHIGLFFFPDLFILRIIGRLSFPLFAWLIANGARHTKNDLAYLSRLILLACVAQIPFTLANQLIGNPAWYLNVVFTLAIGLAAVLVIKHTQKIWLRIAGTVIACAIAYFANTDYSVFGVLLITAMYVFFENFKTMLLVSLVIFILPQLWYMVRGLYYWQMIRLSLYNLSEFPGLISFIFIYLYNKKEGIKAKFLFYVFYPVQYAVLYVLKAFI